MAYPEWKAGLIDSAWFAHSHEGSPGTKRRQSVSIASTSSWF